MLLKGVLKLSSIESVDFPTDQYYKKKLAKKQIVLHHTVSGDSADGDISWWMKTRERVATCIIIERDGTIKQCFSSKYWAHHLGVKVSTFKKHNIPLIYTASNGVGSVANNTLLNQHSIGVELDSWGGLILSPDGWVSATGRVVKDVVEYPDGYRGFYAFEKYTPQQLLSLWRLLKYWKGTLPDIPTNYRESIWDVDRNALLGLPGIYTHNSFRDNKSDCHPQSELKQVLKTV